MGDGRSSAGTHRHALRLAQAGCRPIGGISSAKLDQYSGGDLMNGAMSRADCGDAHTHRE